MNSKATISTRERILQAAESIILQNGFSGTSLEDIIQKAAITKGGFFYHFEGKKGLAKGLVERYLQQDAVLFDSLFLLAEQSSSDPLQQLLKFLLLFAETIQQLEETHPGCLVAGFTYESQQFDEEIRELIHQGVTSWRKMILLRLNASVKTHSIHEGISLDHLADMFTSIVEGGIILSRVYGNNDALYHQVLLYRDYISLVFKESPAV